MKLRDIAQEYQLQLIGDPDVEIFTISTLDVATSGELAFASNSKQIEAVKHSGADAIITTKELASYSTTNTLIADNPYLTVAKLSHQFKRCSASIHSSVIIAPSAVIGKNTTIDAGCFVGENVRIGNDCHLYPGVTIMDNVSIGNHCIISSGAVIGSQGFGNIPDPKGWQNIYHLGGVDIGDNVHIGANTTIDNGTFTNTIIKDGVRIDNLVHIAHNVVIGAHTAIAAQTGIAGSTYIGAHCKIGGQVGIVGHLHIADNTTIYATSTVNKSLKQQGEYTSFMPIMEHSRWKKIALFITKFDKIVKLLGIKVSKL